MRFKIILALSALVLVSDVVAADDGPKVLTAAGLANQEPKKSVFDRLKNRFGRRGAPAPAAQASVISPVMTEEEVIRKLAFATAKDNYRHIYGVDYTSEGQVEALAQEIVNDILVPRKPGMDNFLTLLSRNPKLASFSQIDLIRFAVHQARLRLMRLNRQCPICLDEGEKFLSENKPCLAAVRCCKSDKKWNEAEYTNIYCINHWQQSISGSGCPVCRGDHKVHDVIMIQH